MRKGATPRGIGSTTLSLPPPLAVLSPDEEYLRAKRRAGAPQRIPVLFYVWSKALAPTTSPRSTPGALLCLRAARGTPLATSNPRRTLLPLERDSTLRYAG